MEVVLFQPEIPQNAGNVVRTCAVTGCSLTLVRPLGFLWSDKRLRRAGLDYWDGVDVNFVDDVVTYLESRSSRCYFFSSKATKTYCDVAYHHDDALVFGSETSGLPEILWQRYPEKFVTIPMVPGARCLNLATTVGIIVFEAWRQQGFEIKSGKTTDCS